MKNSKIKKKRHIHALVVALAIGIGMQISEALNLAAGGVAVVLLGVFILIGIFLSFPYIPRMIHDEEGKVIGYYRKKDNKITKRLDSVLDGFETLDDYLKNLSTDKEEG